LMSRCLHNNERHGYTDNNTSEKDKLYNA